MREFVGRGRASAAHRVRRAAVQFVDPLPDGDMLPGFAAVSILVMFKAAMRAQAIGQPGNLRCLALGTEIELENRDQ